MSDVFSPTRRALLAAGLILPVLAHPALAADPAETFVNANIQKGLDILNNKAISKQQKADQFEQFLLGLTDMKRIADFTLGQYLRSAPAGDVQAFEAAFQAFAVANYHYYFSLYSGQTLKVIGSAQRAPTDYVVTTQLQNPNDHSSQGPIEVEFRVRTDGARPVVTDFAVAGAWMSIQQRDQFVSFLGQNNGNVKLLIAHLGELAKKFQ